jgi:hypothetical protein
MSKADEGLAVERYGKGSLVGAAIPAVVAFLALATSVLKGNFSLEAWSTGTSALILSLPPCIAAGAIGTVAAGFARAIAFGAALLFCEALVGVFFVRWHGQPICEALLMSIVAPAVGALCGAGGAIAARTLGSRSDADGPRCISGLELAVAGVLVLYVTIWILAVC